MSVQKESGHPSAEILAKSSQVCLKPGLGFAVTTTTLLATPYMLANNLFKENASHTVNVLDIQIEQFGMFLTFKSSMQTCLLQLGEFECNLCFDSESRLLDWAGVISVIFATCYCPIHLS